MRRIIYGVGLSLSIMALGVVFLAFRLTQGESRSQDGLTPTAQVSHAQVPHNSPLVNLLPDMEYIPVYTDSTTIIESIDKGIWVRVLVYAAPGEQATVADFYRNELPKYGWVFIYEGDANTDYIFAIYHWTDPAGVAPWHQELRLGVDTTDARPGVTEVSLQWNRYPDTGTNLPVYPGAANIEITSTVGSDPDHPKARRRTTIKTYMTEATPEQIATYYNSNLQQYGWTFWQEVGPDGYSGEPKEQAGDINTVEGLHFRGEPHFYTGASFLDITASPAADGKTEVHLKIDEGLEETETPVPKP